MSKFIHLEFVSIILKYAAVNSMNSQKVQVMKITKRLVNHLIVRTNDFD